jgi:hypothetical protein
MAIGGGENRPLRASADHAPPKIAIGGRVAPPVWVAGRPTGNTPPARRTATRSQKDLRHFWEQDREAALSVEESDGRGVEGDRLTRSAAGWWDGRWADAEPKLPVDDFEPLDAVEVAVVGEKRQLVLKAERRDPEVVPEALELSGA